MSETVGLIDEGLALLRLAASALTPLSAVVAAGVLAVLASVEVSELSSLPQPAA